MLGVGLVVAATFLTVFFTVPTFPPPAKYNIAIVAVGCIYGLAYLECLIGTLRGAFRKRRAPLRPEEASAVGGA